MDSLTKLGLAVLIIISGICAGIGIYIGWFGATWR
jgi:hypothetical protein